MKTKILSLLALSLLCFSGIGLAQINPTVSVQGTNATIRWASVPGELYLVHYRRAFHPDTNLQWRVIGTNVPASLGTETTFQHTGGVPLVPAGVGGGGGGGGSPGSPAAATFAAPSASTSDKQKNNAPPDFPLFPDEKALEKWLKDLLKERERHQREGGGLTALSSLMTSSISAAQATSNSMAFYAVSKSTDDSDGDGIPDGYEAQHGLNPLEHDSMLDKDNDTWSNLDEYLLGMNPLVPDPGPSTFAVAVTSGSASETGPTPGTFTVSRTGDLTRALTVYLGWGGTARSTRDYARLTNEITFATGQASFGLTVVPVNDAEFEGPETVKLTLYPDIAYSVGANTEATLTISDNDLPGVSVVATKPDASEAGPTHGEFEFRRTGSTASNLTVNFNLTGSTAANGSDYNTIATSVVIPAGANATNLSITVINDSAFEGTETVVLNLTDHVTYSVSNRTATVTIADNDLPVVTIVANMPNASESGPVAGQFTFTRTGSTAAALRVDYGIGGTATNGGDYQLITNFVTIPVGSTTAPLTITPISNASVEFLEFVTLTVRGSDLYDIGAANSATVLIDDAAAPIYGWRTVRSSAVNTNNPAINVPAIVEIFRTGSVLGATNFPFTVNATPANYSVTNVHGAIVGSNVSFAAGRTNVLIEIRPTLTTQLAGVSFAVPAITGGAGAQIHFLASSYYVSNIAWTTNETSESGGLLTLRATRQVLGPPVTIPITLTGLATPSDLSGADHNQPTSVILTIPTNSLTGDLVVTAANDGLLEGWESVVAIANAFSPGAAPAALWRRMSFIRESVTDTSFLPEGDTDGDGLPDRWEIQFGYDPTVADDITLDADKDGLNLADEYTFGTNPTNAVSFGTNDYRFSRVTNTVDSVPVRLVVGDTGKHNNGMNCAICHTTGLQVGGTRLRSFDRFVNADRVVNLEKGKSYPVRLIDLLGILPPVTANTATPTNTARYSAQILAVDTNMPNFLLDDPQAILGTNKVWVSNVFTNTNAVVTIPKLQLRVDANRDGLIKFDSSDATTTAKPYRFWVNDDRDSGSSDTAEDLNPVTGALDNSDNFLIDLRDLEDLSRLHLQVGGVLSKLQSGSVVASLEMVSVAGVPAVRVFPAADADGGLGYITNLAVATSQTFPTSIYRQGLGVVSPTARLDFPASFWSSSSGTNGSKYLVFEGCVVGSGLLKLVLRRSGQVVAESPPVHIELNTVTKMYEHYTVGDTATMDWRVVPEDYSRTTDSASYQPESPETKDYILFVHGWRMEPWERRAFASTAFKRLWWQRYKGRFGLFSWPTEPENLVVQNYDRSERKGWLAAEGLKRLLQDLNGLYPGKVRAVAHSMGNIVISEALLSHALNWGTPVVHTYVASQAASVAHAYDFNNPETLTFIPDTPESYATYPVTARPYFERMGNAVRRVDGKAQIVNYHNYLDHAFSFPFWQANQKLKPDHGWTYHWKTWYRLGPDPSLEVKLSFPFNTYEIFSHIAEARSHSLGAAQQNGRVIRGIIAEDVNLNGGPFLYANGSHEHSAQFRSVAMNRHSYWATLLNTFVIVP